MPIRHRTHPDRFLTWRGAAGTRETPPINGWNYSVEFHRIFPRVAAKYNVPLVPFLLTGVALNPDLNGDDEIHPNAAGARMIADTVWPFLEPLVAQAAVR